MKVLIVGNGGFGNVDGKYTVNKHTAQFTEELNELGLDVGFLQFEVIIRANAGLQDCSLTESISVYSMMLEQEKGKFRKIFSYFKMLLLVIKTILQYDFIYIFYPGHVPLMASAVCMLLGKNYGLYVRGQHDLETKLGRLIVKRAEFCLTVSDLLKEQLLKNNNNCETIAPMIDFSKKDILLNREYSKDGITRCLFVGRVELRKGIYDLVDAIEVLNRETDNLHFDIAGGGDSFDEIKESMKGYSNITFYGQVSEKEQLLALYRQADLFIFPSHDEGFPRVLYEAMMARTPVVTTMVGGIGGFMKDHHNCLAIEPKNPESIVSAVEEILDSEELRSKLVEQATLDVLKLFDGTRKKHSELLLNQLEVLL